MSLRDLLMGRTGALVDLAAGAAAASEPVADQEVVPASMGGSGPVDPLLRTIRAASAEEIHRDIAMSIPAVRKAQHVIAGTISTFALAAWSNGQRLAADDPRSSWLRQPDPAKTLQTTLLGTIEDGIWWDRSVWQVLDRTITGSPVKFRRIQPSRISTVADQWDPDLIDTWTIDGKEVPARNIVHINFAGLGGLKRWGVEMLELYLDLQLAAGNYAKAPHPKGLLKNKGADLNHPAIQALLDDWEAARATRSVGYLNSVMEYDTFGWNADELQLTEAREHAALEVARLFGLPAAAVDAPTGDSMTYGNVVEKRRDVLEALRPWMTAVEQALSLDDRSSRPTGLVMPHGVEVKFDVDAYTRDDPETRMRTWQAAKAAGVLSESEIRAAEPLATSDAPPPAPLGAPAPAAVPPTSPDGAADTAASRRDVTPPSPRQEVPA